MATHKESDTAERLHTHSRPKVRGFWTVHLNQKYTFMFFLRKKTWLPGTWVSQIMMWESKKTWEHTAHSGQWDSVQFKHSVVSNSATPWTAARQASLSITNFQSLLKLMSIESVMPLWGFISRILIIISQFAGKLLHSWLSGVRDLPHGINPILGRALSFNKLLTSLRSPYAPSELKEYTDASASEPASSLEQERLSTY